MTSDLSRIKTIPPDLKKRDGLERYYMKNKYVESVVADICQNPGHGSPCSIDKSGNMTGKKKSGYAGQWQCHQIAYLSGIVHSAPMIIGTHTHHTKTYRRQPPATPYTLLEMTIKHSDTKEEHTPYLTKASVRDCRDPESETESVGVERQSAYTYRHNTPHRTKRRFGINNFIGCSV